MTGKRTAPVCYFRNAASALCVTVCVVLLFFWIRSYRAADRFHLPIWGKQSFVVASKEGRLILVGYKSDPAPNEWKTGTYSFPLDDDQAFPLRSVRTHESAAGFGIIRRPKYFVPEWRKELPEKRPGYFVIWSAMFKTLNGSGAIVPYWFGVLVSAVVLVLIWARRPWRYSIRSLLIAVSFIAILLGMIAVLDNGAPR